MFDGAFAKMEVFCGKNSYIGSIIDDSTQRGDHSSGPMRNPKLSYRL